MGEIILGVLGVIHLFVLGYIAWLLQGLWEIARGNARYVRESAMRLQESTDAARSTARAVHSAGEDLQATLRYESRKVADTIDSVAGLLSGRAADPPEENDARGGRGGPAGPAPWEEPRHDAAPPALHSERATSPEDFLRRWVRDRRRPEGSEWRVVTVRYEGRSDPEGLGGSSALRFRPVARLAEFVCLHRPESETGFVYPHPEANLAPEILESVYRYLGVEPPGTLAAISETAPIRVRARDDVWESV